MKTPASPPRESRFIITDFWPKPIPDRRFDWLAVTDDYDGAPDSHCEMGWGPTEEAAIADLKDQLEEKETAGSGS